MVKRLFSLLKLLNVIESAKQSREPHKIATRLMVLAMTALCFFNFSSIAEDEILGTNLEKETEINQDGELVEENFTHDQKNATIQILNKITAKAQYLNIPVKSQVTLGTLMISVEACWKSSPYDLSENKILLNVSEKKIGQEKYNVIFNGWMFSSSPGISSLEHAVYDIVAINCYN